MRGRDKRIARIEKFVRLRGDGIEAMPDEALWRRLFPDGSEMPEDDEELLRRLDERAANDARPPRAEPS